MPKTNLVTACIDFDNHRTEYQKLVNIMIDEKRSLNDFITKTDEGMETLSKLKEAHNDNCEAIEKLANVVNSIVSMLEGVLTEESFNNLKNIIKEGLN